MEPILLFWAAKMIDRESLESSRSHGRPKNKYKKKEVSIASKNLDQTFSLWKMSRTFKDGLTL